MVFYYDLEVFPNFFSALLISEDFEQEFVFYKFKDVNQIPELLAFVSQPDLTLVGYNSVHYDDVIMKCLLAKPEITNRQIFNTSKKIISVNKVSELPRGLKQLAYDKPPWRTADMMNVLKINTNRPSLKHCAIHLEHELLQDLPKPFDEKVKPDEVETILKYNRNDVVITGKIWCLPKIKEAMHLRQILGERYGVDLYSADDSKIANVVLEKAYGKPSVGSTRRLHIYGKQLIPETLEFKTPEMLAIQKTIEELHLVEYKTKKDTNIHLTYPKYEAFQIIFEFDGTKYKMAKGGLHSDDQPRLLENTDEHIYRDCDVGSYYPILGQRYEIAPDHLDKDRFLHVAKELIDTRLAAKHSGDKVTADGLKIAVNGIFGKFNYDGFWLYDPLCLYQTTIYGQLLLLMLIEMLYLEGIQTVSANTDGIVCKIPIDKEAVYFETCVEWQQITGMSLEYTDYKFLAQLNVNSYMSHAIREGVHNEDWSVKWSEKDSIKTKKDFLDNKSLNKASFVKGYSAPVISLALRQYFKNGILPEDTINNHINVHDFFYTQKASWKFYFVYQHPDGSEDRLQKTNRFYIGNFGGVIVKRDKTDYDIIEKEDFEEYGYMDHLEGETSRVTRQTSIWKGQYTIIMNDIVPVTEDINRQFYIDKVYEIVNKIVPPPVKKQLTVFDFI